MGRNLHWSITAASEDQRGATAFLTASRKLTYSAAKALKALLND
jgi:hypothetical protein